MPLHPPSSPGFARLYAPFAAAYLLSYLYRTVGAVIAPTLAHEFSLSHDALGLLTSAYLFAFGVAQLPGGMLLDRYGPRRVETVLLTIAAAGALAFALAPNVATLTLARAAIGFGMALCLAAPLKAASAWLPVQRRAAFSGWMLLAGGIGALLASSPAEALLRHASWREMFAGLALLTVLAAAGVFRGVAELPPAAVKEASADAPSGWREQWRGALEVFRHPRFHWVAPWAMCGMGSYIAIHGLWSVQWMIHAEGMGRGAAAGGLFAMSLTAVGGYFLIGSLSVPLARRGIDPPRFLMIGMVLHLAALAAIVFGAPGGALRWVLYGLGCSLNVLTYTVLASGLPGALAGRAYTAINLAVFTGSPLLQWGIGIGIAALERNGFSVPVAFRLVFAGVLALNAAAFVWFASRRKMFENT